MNPAAACPALGYNPQRYSIRLMKQFKYLAILGGLALVGYLLVNGYVIEGFDFFGIQIRKPNTEQSTANTRQATPDATTPSTRRESDRPPPEEDTPPPRYATINLAYTGDMYGCVLSLFVRIGNKEFRPQGSFFQVDRVEQGMQSYEVTGQISCPGVGMCQAQGDGTLDVVPNATYTVAWQNVAMGQCSVMLSE